MQEIQIKKGKGTTNFGASPAYYRRTIGTWEVNTVFACSLLITTRVRPIRAPVVTVLLLNLSHSSIITILLLHLIILIVITIRGVFILIVHIQIIILHSTFTVIISPMFSPVLWLFIPTGIILRLNLTIILLLSFTVPVSVVL